MDMSMVVLLIAIFIIGILSLLLYKKSSIVPSASIQVDTAVDKLPNRQLRHCPNCGDEVSMNARKCPHCKEFIGVCPTCDKDSLFSSSSTKGKRKLKIQIAVASLGWPISTIATCSSCDSHFLLCRHCATPVPTMSENCPNCGAKLVAGIVPIIKDVGEVVSGLLTGKKIGRK